MSWLYTNLNAYNWAIRYYYAQKIDRPYISSKTLIEEMDDFLRENTLWAHGCDPSVFKHGFIQGEIDWNAGRKPKRYPYFYRDINGKKKKVSIFKNQKSR